MASLNNSDAKYAKLFSKLCIDLEDLVKKLVDIQNQKQEELLLVNSSNNTDTSLLCAIGDDCIELQKFCSKLEFLLQFKLKEKKSLLLSAASNDSSNSNSDVSANREYWSFMLEIFKSSRSFQDGVKFVRNLTEVKTNLGRGRAFIRFCLHYHRLADAVQQLMMEHKLVSNWYQEKAVWYEEELKSRIFQLLYDLNDVNFDLISKNNYELDTTWPTCQLTNGSTQKTQSKPIRNRTISISSFTSFNMDAISVLNSQSTNPNNTNNNINDNSNSLLSSTPLEMDDNLSRLNQSNTDDDHEDNQDSNYLNDSASIKQNHSSDATISRLNAMIETLTEQLNFKTKQNSDLNNCLIKQTNLCENLSDMLKKSQQKNADLETTLEKSDMNILNLQNENETLKGEKDAVKFELSGKVIQGENLVKETLVQTQQIMSLKHMSAQQEAQINQLKSEYASIKQERNNEIEMFQHDIKRLQVAIQLKEEENYLLNDKIQKLSQSLDDERKQLAHALKELSELKLHNKTQNEKNTKQINQLEMDNNEIKKRLVKLIKEKAELWQKADNLEYENLLKTNAMWVDDASISNCMSCKSGFSLMLRKHHCRICLKIYCYYCCNNWIEYNHSQLRVCQRCFEAKINTSSSSTSLPRLPQQSIVTETKSSLVGAVSATIEPTTSSSIIPQSLPTDQEEDEEDDDDPDINFEVRSEKLNLSAFNSAEHSGNEEKGNEEDDDDDIYKSSEIPTHKKNPTKSPDSSIHKEETNKRTEASIESKQPQPQPHPQPQSQQLLQNQNEEKKQFKLKYIPKELTTQISQNDYTDIDKLADDLIIQHKRVNTKKKQQQQPFKKYSTSELVVDEDEYYDTFAIVSQDEIDKV